MGIVFLFLLYALLGSGSSIIPKFFQKSDNSRIIGKFLYTAVNAFWGCAFFFCASGFDLTVNFDTVFYGAMYGFIGYCYALLLMYLFSRENIFTVRTFADGGGLLFPVIFGMIFLSEKMSVFLFAALALVMFAILLPSLRSGKSGIKFSSFLLCILFALSGGAGAIVVKMFTLTESADAQNSMFFFTNAFTLLLAVLTIGVLTIKDKSNTAELITLLKKKEIYMIVINTPVASFAAIVLGLIYAGCDISFANVFTNSLTLIFSMLISRFLYKEHITKTNVICLIALFLAICFNFLHSYL